MSRDTIPGSRPCSFSAAPTIPFLDGNPQLPRNKISPPPGGVSVPPPFRCSLRKPVALRLMAVRQPSGHPYPTRNRIQFSQGEPLVRQK